MPAFNLTKTYGLKLVVTFMIIVINNGGEPRETVLMHWFWKDIQLCNFECVHLDNNRWPHNRSGIMSSMNRKIRLSGTLGLSPGLMVTLTTSPDRPRLTSTPRLRASSQLVSLASPLQHPQTPYLCLTISYYHRQRPCLLHKPCLLRPQLSQRCNAERSHLGRSGS